MAVTAIDFRGQPAVVLETTHGRCVVALHGGQLLSWQTGEQAEHVFLSPGAVFDGRMPIRGGVPVCWPQFNQRGALPKHGFARTSRWQVDSGANPAADELRLVLRDDEATRALWPHAFRLVMAFRMAPGSLQIVLDVHNVGGAPWSFTAALHSYLRVADVRRCELRGLQGANSWDAVRDERRVETAQALRFGAEFDRVYAAPAAPLHLFDAGAPALEITQSASCTETVVWNPGPELAARLSDLPEDTWRQMLCVEAACIDAPVLLEPGACWQGWQQLRVA